MGLLFVSDRIVLVSFIFISNNDAPINLHTIDDILYPHSDEGDSDSNQCRRPQCGDQCNSDTDCELNDFCTKCQ